MKPKTLLSTILAVTISMLFTGCDTTSQGISGTQLKANLQQIKLGLTSDQVVALIGKPAHINTTFSASGKSEQWVYTSSQFWTPGQAAMAGALAGTSDGVIHENQTYMYFTNGKLTSLQTSQ